MIDSTMVKIEISFFYMSIYRNAKARSEYFAGPLLWATITRHNSQTLHVSPNISNIPNFVRFWK